MTGLELDRGKVPLVGARKVVQLLSQVIPGQQAPVVLGGEDQQDEGQPPIPPQAVVMTGPPVILLYALCDDGTIWVRQANARGQDGRPLPWSKVTGPPEHDAAGFSGDPRGLSGG